MPKVNQHNNQSTSQYSKVRVGQSRGVSCAAKSANMLTNSRMWPTAHRSKATAIRNTYTSYLCCFINTYFYFPTRLVRVFPSTAFWTNLALVTDRCVFPSPPRHLPSFLPRRGFSAPTARRFSSQSACSRSRPFGKGTRLTKKREQD